MTDPKRLFDCLELNVERENLPDMLAGKENGKKTTERKYNPAQNDPLA